jgi:hypothetical protein
MNQLNKNVANILLHSAIQHSGIMALSADSGLPVETVHRALLFGTVDVANFVTLTRCLGLDAGAVLAEASAASQHNFSHEVEQNPWIDASDSAEPIPTDKYMEIQLIRERGVFNPSPDRYIARYIADGDRWMTGYDNTIAHSLVARWREATTDQIARLARPLATA